MAFVSWIDPGFVSDMCFSDMPDDGCATILDGFVKSPDAALRCTLRRCSVPKSTLRSSGFARLACELFTKPSPKSTFYEGIPLLFLSSSFWRRSIFCGPNLSERSKASKAPSIPTSLEAVQEAEMIVQIDTDAPDFEMQDFRGASIRLSDFKNRKNVVIVFNRGFF